MTGWRTATLSDREKALCTFAEKLTQKPASMTPADLDVLRAHELDDRDIHDATQVIGYFNYINRVADALGTDLEPDMPALPEGWNTRHP
ncbi:MAG: carboxymuconolactone decarboxylase family protein [Planctomycetota bacterium]|jgi:uncharacterized peroxidase-related enzyme